MAIVIAAACLLVGGWALFRSLRALVRGVRSRTWPAANGVIEEVVVEKKLNSDDEEVSRQDVEYSYCVGPNKYRGTRIRFGLARMLRWSSKVNPSFRRGGKVSVVHSPSRPSISALERGFSPFVLFPLAVGAAFVWMGIQLLLSIP